MHRRRCTSSPGFTLIEILIVLAIVSILAAILFPVFATVREKGRSAVCQSNLRQIGLAILQYSADHDDRLPYAPSCYDKEFIARPRVLYGEPLDSLVLSLDDIRVVLRPYGVQNELFRCPSDSTGHLYSMIEEPGFWKPTFFEHSGSSYGYDTQRALKGKRLSSLDNPALSYLSGDIDDFHGTSAANGNIYSRGARFNLLFVDGHVKSCDWAQTSQATVESQR